MNPFDRIDQLSKEKHSMEIAALKLADDYDALKSDLARVTAERDQLQSIAEKRYEEFRREANAHFVAAGEIEKLEAALRNVVAWTEPFYAHEVRDFESARALLDRAESDTPAKHPDTEIVDWLEVDPQARLAEVRRLIFIDRDTVREAVHAARKQEVSRE